MDDLKSYPILLPNPSGDNLPPVACRISFKEKSILDNFLESGSIADTAKNAQLSEDTVKDYLERTQIKAYLAKRIYQAAQSKEVNYEKIMGIICDVLEGRKTLDASQARTLDLAARILKMVTPGGINIVTQVHVENPFSAMKDEELNEAIKGRLQWQTETK